MSIFNLFKKRQEPIRPFFSDADKFSTEQIIDLMKRFKENPDELPPVKSDDYVKSLIERLKEEPDITVLDKTVENGVYTISFSIKRNDLDYVALSYQLFNSNVVYITTYPYGFTGDRESFLSYCNSFQYQFPMISIGCKNFDRKINLPTGETNLATPMYAVRTCVPLLGNELDFINLATALRTLPIYGYDLRDGFRSGNIQPYASSKTGINIQLEKLVNLHQFKDLKKELYPADIALYGHAPFSKLSTEIPGRLSNPYLQYLNFCSNSDNMFTQSGSNQILHFRTKLRPNDKYHTFERVGDTQLVCYTNYPTLYTIEINNLIRLKNDDTISKVLELMAWYNFPSISDNPRDYALYKVSVLPYDNSEETFILKKTMTQCLPNEVSAATLAMQIVDFFDKCGYDMSSFLIQEH